MADYFPSFTPAGQVTFTASADVTGGRLVEITGDRTVGPAGAASAAVIGVAGFDAVAGERVTVYTRVDGAHGLTAAGAITAGDTVAAAADGKVATAAEDAPSIGIALSGAATDDVIDVLFI